MRRVYRDEGVGWWVGFKGTRELQAIWGVGRVYRDEGVVGSVGVCIGFTGIREL